MTDVSSAKQKILDCHVHWWDLENNYYPWLMDRKSDDSVLAAEDLLAQTYLPEHYFADAEGFDVIGFVHIEASWDPKTPLDETRWLKEMLKKGFARNLPTAIVAAADLRKPDIETLLEQHKAVTNVRGIRHILNYIADKPDYCWAEGDYLQDPTWHDNFGLLKKYDLDFDLMCFSNHLPGMIEVARKHPDIRIHLEHTGMPHDHTEEGRSAWRAGLMGLAALDNTDIKISGLGNTIADWTEKKVRPYVLEAIDIFGTKRVAFASNFPTDKQFSGLADIWNAFFSITSDFSQDEKNAMFAENAARMYGLTIR